MIEERKVKRPGLVRVSDPGDLDVRSIRLNAGSIGCTLENFAAAIGVSVKALQRRKSPQRCPVESRRSRIFPHHSYLSLHR
jgi:hypothetical protein